VSESDFDASEFDTTKFDDDDRLRALLRSGDPADALPPADPAALKGLLEDVMSADLEIRPAGPEAEPRRRTRATWLVAAAAVAVIAAGGAFAVVGLTGDDAGAPQADQPSASSPASGLGTPVAGKTTELTAGTAARCVGEPTAALLSQYDQAFQGTVTAIDGDTVTLQTADVFNGEVGETVHVSAPRAGFDQLLNQVQFKVGGTYLVSAYQGSVSLCGFSGPATGDLHSLYEKAFVR
jgi:hypothetical protein